MTKIRQEKLDELVKLMSEVSTNTMKLRAKFEAKMDKEVEKLNKNLNRHEIGILRLIAEGPTTLREIQKEYAFYTQKQMSLSSISNYTNKLFKEALIEKNVSRENVREFVFTINEHGKSIVDSSKNLRRNLYIEILDSMELSEEEAIKYIEILRRCATNMSAKNI